MCVVYKFVRVAECSLRTYRLSNNKFKLLLKTHKFLVLDKIVKLDLRLTNDFMSETLTGRNIDTWRTWNNHFLAPPPPNLLSRTLRVLCDDSLLSATESAFEG